MALFRCTTSQGSGGNGADLIVTCSSGFAGSTITCTDGTTTFTQTCPSTSPYTVTFESIPTGTWTISGVAQGQTFSTTKTITDFTEELSDIPDGATKTPTDDIQIWLHCANIWDKNYTTISAVLADTTTLLALISSNNAVDYMARSTTWASSVVANSTAMTYIGANNYCANKLLADSTWCSAICNSTYFENVLNVKVPTMTSNTTPSGECFADSSYNANYNQPWRAFDNSLGSTTYYWASLKGINADGYLGYTFTSSVRVYKVVTTNVNAGSKRVTNTIRLQYYDGSWKNAASFTSQSPSTAGAVSTYIANHSYSSTKWRLLFVADSSVVELGLDELQFYGRAAS